MANENGMGRDRDLVLAPGEYAYVLDTTKGLVNVIVGPNKTSMSNTDQPVVWDKSTLRFVRVDTDKAIQRNPIAPEGFYLALYNPAPDNGHPREGSMANAAPLTVGHRMNIPGPVHFPLWPGQMAEVIRGHHLRSNQYLLAQVYNETAANENWKQAVIKPPAGEAADQVLAPTTFTPGQTMVIRGTDVAFFIPPTGIKVVEEGKGIYVREAVTLERLEYCILLDEDGNKRFVKGPDVVFPEPTETFVEKDGKRKFRAIELNENSGIYVKVIADYTEEDGTARKAGEELFITGSEQAIYFQREEHAIIRYGDQTKHYAVAVPAGEGRYVLNRQTGDVRLAVGPTMLLCDPRREVIIRRVLDDRMVQLWYPGNARALQVNRELREQHDPHAGAYEVGRQLTSSQTPITANYMAIADVASTVSMASAGIESAANQVLRSRQVAGDQMNRGTAFTPPRTITLDTKYEGAVGIAIWPGYAVLAIDKTGNRRVIQGPDTVLLEYDETLAPMELSTGTPKSDTKVVSTVYLRTQNNRVSDSITVETADLVRVTLRLAYRVNFNGDDPTRWFAVENYVRLLCDHARSRVRNAVKRLPIAGFYAAAIDVVRDTLLGPAAPAGAREGLVFSENGMRVYDVEVLDVDIDDEDVSALFGAAQREALSAAMLLQKAQRDLDLTVQLEAAKRQTVEAQAETQAVAQRLEEEKIRRMVLIALAKVEGEAAEAQGRLDAKQAEQVLRDTITAAELARAQREADQKQTLHEREIDLELKQLMGETTEVVKRAEAIDGKLSAALVTLSDQAMVKELAKSLAPMAAMSGISAAEVLGKLFKGTAIEGVMTQLSTRAGVGA